MVKKLLCSAVAGVAAGLFSVAQAGTISFAFDPDGAGAAYAPIQNVTLIDQAPGNALAVGGVTAIQSYLGGGSDTGFTLYYQANLSVLKSGNNIVFANGLAGAPTFTFAAAFGETVQSAAGLPGNASFGLDLSNPVNYFRMYASPAVGNDLTGAGFAVGTIILEGTITAMNSSSFTLTSAAPGTPLDGNGSNDWPGTTTVVGSGATDLTVTITSFDADYFPNLSASNLYFSFFNTSQVTPFAQTDPSRQVLGNPSNVGAVNGLSGPDFLFQADANQSLVAEIPEPGIMPLLALGLIATGFAVRRRSATRK